MNRLLGLILSSVLLFACAANGKSLVAANDTNNFPRIVAIGDVHGDFDQFVKLLQATGLVDRRKKWIGGDAHLVQLGDLPDRGPDTRKVMDLLMKLEQRAAKAGGAITVLIGNHEAMNMTDDLRYVHPGEYEAFVDRNSKARQSAYYEQTKAYLRSKVSVEELPVFDKTHRLAWQKKFPLGYVEHRLAWAPTGEYGKWVLSRPAVAVVGDSLFVHGGVSEAYANMPVSEINTRIRTELAIAPKLAPEAISEDPNGPLWYRGWASMDATPVNQAALQRVLDAYSVRRMVVAHTPLLPIVLPRFGGKFLMVDVGLSQAYGHGFSALEIVNGEAFAVFSEGRLRLPSEVGDEALLDYLLDAEKLATNPKKVAQYRERYIEAAARLENQTVPAKAGVNP